LGLTVCLLLSLFANYELSYDKQFSDVENKYRVVASSDEGDKMIVQPWKLAELLNSQIPGIKHVVRLDCFTLFENNIFRYKEKSFKEKGYFKADNGFFSIFNYKFISGNPKTALENPNGGFGVDATY